MSVHTSLRSIGKAAGAQRNVLKRFERVRHLMGQGLWGERRSAVGLPKIKQLKIKSRKAAAKEKDETAAGATPAGTPPASA